MTAWMIGVDTGGTFTDMIAFNAHSGERRAVKVSSIPSDPSMAVANALTEIVATGVSPSDVSMLVHGTTVATNAVLEGAGARTGLLITQGFNAVYEARGWTQPISKDLLDTFYRKPPLLVPQALTKGIRERIDHRGRIALSLDEDDVREAVRDLAKMGVESVAICYLFSFLNPGHEERTAAIVAEMRPDWRISLSSRVLPVVREYPRLSTTVLDAYVGPTMSAYLTRLSDRLSAKGITTPQVYLMQSNGGLMKLSMGARFPNQTLLSGPAAAVVAGMQIAKMTAKPNIITFDMGGTSTDIGLVIDGSVTESRMGSIAGQDIATPMLRVDTYGAGGGTIAAIGPDGLLKVGPRSAGAIPGPACYGRGGDRPTVTDANLILGALAADDVLGGRVSLDRNAAEVAIKRNIAEPLDLGVVEAAAGVIRILTNNIAIGLRLAFQSNGQDPRRFALAALGGAGPLHAAVLARAVQVPTVIVPPHPGMTSAMGLLQTSVRHSYLRSAVGLLSTYSLDTMHSVFGELKALALADAREEGFGEAQVRIKRRVDLRYLYQGYELSVDCPPGPLGDHTKADLKRAFDEMHARVYGANARDEDAEIMTFRILAEIDVPRLDLGTQPSGDGNSARAIVGERDIWDVDGAGFTIARVYDRAKLLAGDKIQGAAVIRQFDSTTVIPRGYLAIVDAFGNLLIDTGLKQ